MPWKEFREKGVWTGPAYRYYKYDRIFKTPSKKFEFCSGNLERLWPEKGKSEESRDRLKYLPHHENIRFMGDPAKYPLLLLTYQPLLHMGAGSQNYPWAQSIFLVTHGVGWTNFAELNGETAKAMKIKDGDLLVGGVVLQENHGQSPGKRRGSPRGGVHGAGSGTYRIRAVVEGDRGQPPGYYGGGL